MADRKNKRAYLDDFQRDLNGNYQYCGKHCHYVGKTPRKTVLLRLWLLCGGAAALTAGAGFVPGATAHMPAYVSLSYVAALLAAVYALYTLLRMTAGGEPLRAYLHGSFWFWRRRGISRRSRSPRRWSTKNVKHPATCCAGMAAAYLIIYNI